MSILVIGSVALDSLETPFGKRRDILGGSATFFSISASFFDKVAIVATVGEDFPSKYVRLFNKIGIGTAGLTVSKGLTFRWEGRYDTDLNTAHTISTHLNVFKDFDPSVPAHLRNPKLLFLANIDPDLQYKVLGQVKRPDLVACDSMNYWINTKRRSLLKLLRRIDMVLLNDAEARLLSHEHNLLKAAKGIISLGPKAVIIKRGEHGVLYFSKNNHFVAPAYPLETLCDPTGAGDTFAGGMVGYLARAGAITESSVRRSLIYGSVMASFTVEGFGVDRLLRLSKKDIQDRFKHYKGITKF